MIILNDDLRERLLLSRERIEGFDGADEIKAQLSPKFSAEIGNALAAFFMDTKAYLDGCFFVMDQLWGEQLTPWDAESDVEADIRPDWGDITLEQWQEMNRCLYGQLAEGAYEKSMANPKMALRLGTYGEVLSFLLAEIYSMPVYIHEGNFFMVTTLLELFLEIFCLCCQEEAPTVRSLQDSVRYYALDYAEEIVGFRIRSTFTPEENTAFNIVMKGDLTDERYLYQYGEYISDTELKLAEFMQSLSEEEIDAMAATLSRGFRRGFETMRVSFEGKKSVQIRYHVGQERMIRRVIEQFREMGLSPILSRCAASRINRKGVIRQGIESTPPSRQFEYDHRMDEALFLDQQFAERKLSAMRKGYESIADRLPGYAGPVVVETFGEETFLPEAREGVIRLTEEQRELATRMTSQGGQISEEYLPGDSYSFSIIAWPLPDIGPDFHDIFRETVKLNTLQNEVYLPLQQRLIDALDPADHVIVEGAGDNRTRISVKLRKLASPEKETQFENCVADVNIPLGEIFTSPVLAGTEGVLHVSRVYLNGYLFLDLSLTFKDGVVTDYSCGNYADAEAGRRYIEENILFHHTTLPIGEFAIGTNVPAYVMAKKYDILGKLPILIVEKTGPHFAVGDTCYSHAEETAVYNPNGKEIISRENSFSLLRDTEPEKAYFNCHTDITIPYEEIGRITAVYPDGSEVDILRDGRFVLPGTEELNRAFG